MGPQNKSFREFREFSLKGDCLWKRDLSRDLLNNELSRDPLIFSRKKSRSSAVGSALRSGRRGRAFESPLLDNKRFWLKTKVAFCFACLVIA